jgi:two-component system NtrC family sensor kinase
MLQKIKKLLLVQFAMFFLVHAQDQQILFRQTNFIPDIDDAYGVHWRDLDGDSLVDLYIVSFRDINRVLLNRPLRNRFIDATIRSGLGGNLNPRGSENIELGGAVFDYDNDGDPDVLICGWGEATRLLRNDEKLIFTDVTPVLRLPPDADINDALVFDFDNDGFLDLFLTDEHFTNKLLLNQGDGTFRPLDNTGLSDTHGISQTASLADVDGDGDMDLYVCNWSGADWFYERLDSLQFRRRVLDLPTLAIPVSSNSSTFCDFDRDGDWDLLVATRSGRNFFYINNLSESGRSWQFSEEGQNYGLGGEMSTYGAAFADLDGDGWEDIFFANLGRNYIFHNDNGQGFTAIESGLDSYPAYSTGSAFADFDGDGDWDLFVANKDTFSLLYQNRNQPRNAVRIRLEGVFSNRDATGATVFLHKYRAAERLTMHMHAGNAAYLSQHQPLILFYPPDSLLWDLHVRFPSGRIISKTMQLAPQEQYIYEAGKSARLWQDTRATFRRLQQRRNLFEELFLILVILAFAGLFIYQNQKLRGRPRILRPVLLLTFFSSIFSMALFFTDFAILTRLLWLVLLAAVLNVLPWLSKLLWRDYQRRLDDFRTHLLTTSSHFHRFQERSKLIEFVIQQLRQSPLISEVQFSIPGQSQASDSTDDAGETDVCSEFEESEQMHFPCILEGRNIGNLLICPAPRQNGKLRLNNGIIKSFVGQLARSLRFIEILHERQKLTEEITANKVRAEFIARLEKQNKLLEDRNRELEQALSELGKTQSQLVLSEKMASLGRLLAGLAHELNNPVAFVYANVKQLQKAINTLAEKDQTGYKLAIAEVEDILTDTRQGANSLKNLVGNLKRFAHSANDDWHEIDLNEVLETCLLIAGPELGHNVKVKRQLLGKHKVLGHIGELQQVFLNLIINAAQAMSGAGHLQILTQVEADIVTITIVDNGGGIPADKQDNIFEPFFTTKAVGEGVGLGLSISRSIINRHGGKITFESREKEGSRFTVILPLADAME